MTTVRKISHRGFLERTFSAGALVLGARMMLEEAAAGRFGVPVSEVKAQNHFVVHTKSGRKLAFGELAAAAAKLTVPRPAGVGVPLHR